MHADWAVNKPPITHQHFIENKQPKARGRVVARRSRGDAEAAHAGAPKQVIPRQQGPGGAVQQADAACRVPCAAGTLQFTDPSHTVRRSLETTQPEWHQHSHCEFMGRHCSHPASTNG